MHKAAMNLANRFSSPQREGRQSPTLLASGHYDGGWFLLSGGGAAVGKEEIDRGYG